LAGSSNAALHHRTCHDTANSMTLMRSSAVKCSEFEPDARARSQKLQLHEWKRPARSPGFRDRPHRTRAVPAQRVHSWNTSFYIANNKDRMRLVTLSTGSMGAQGSAPFTRAAAGLAPALTAVLRASPHDSSGLPNGSVGTESSAKIPSALQESSVAPLHEQSWLAQ